MATNAPTTQANTQTYTYQPGDTYWSLASQYGGGGVNWGQIQALNPSLDPRNVQPGTQINLPANWNTSGQQSSNTSAYTPPAASQPYNFTATANMNAGSALDVIANQQSQLAQANKNYLNTLSGTIPDIEKAYDVVRGQYQGDINTAEANAALQGQKLTDQYNAAQQSVLTTAGVQQQQLQNQEQAATGNAAASAIARGESSNDPFVQVQKQAAGQPYEQQLTQLNVQTQQNLANLAVQYSGMQIDLTTATNQQIQQISDAIAQLAPQETAQVANINLQIAQTQLQQEQGLISNELAAYKIDTSNALKEQQIQATVQAAQIRAGATYGAAQIRAQAALTTATMTAQKNADTIYNNILNQNKLQADVTTGGGLFGIGSTTTGRKGQVDTRAAQNDLYNYLSQNASTLDSFTSQYLWGRWRELELNSGYDPTTGQPLNSKTPDAQRYQIISTTN